MDEFPALGSTLTRVEFKKKTNGKNKGRQPQVSSSPPDSLKKLARFIRESETNKDDTSTTEYPGNSHCCAEGSQLNKESSPVSDTAQQPHNHDPTTQKMTKMKKKTKFVPMDLRDSADVHRREGQLRKANAVRIAHDDISLQSDSSKYLTFPHQSDICEQDTSGSAMHRTEDINLSKSCFTGQQKGMEAEVMFGDVCEVFMFDSKPNSSGERVPMKEYKENERESRTVIQDMTTQALLEVKPNHIPHDGKVRPVSPTKTVTKHTLSVSPDYPEAAGFGVSDKVPVKFAKTPSGFQKRGKKHVMRPIPDNMLGFKTKREPYRFRHVKEKETTDPAVIGPETKTRRRKTKEKRKLITPTIQSDGSDSFDDTDQKIYEWVYWEPDDRDLDMDSIKRLNSKPSAVIGLTFARCTDALLGLLKQHPSCLDEELVLVSVISKGCCCPVIPHCGKQVLSLLQNEDLFNSFLRSLFSEMNEHISTLDRFMLQSFFTDVIKLLNAQKVTSRGRDPTVLPRLVLMGMARKWRDFLGDTHAQIILELETQREVKAEESAAAVLSSDDNYRKVSIMPTNDDINPHVKPSLKENKVKGSYSNVDEYLDLQFRLIREDFIQPLRDGISEYQDFMHKKDKRALRLYQNVKIMRVICSENGIVYRMQFDVARLSHVDWNNTKRLMYGSMVCISDDKFETVRFATVSDRKPERLQQGRVDVKFDSKAKLDSKTSFAMVETPALFEAYRHILQSLQSIDSSTLAFKRYFVECEKSVKEPQYLNHQYSSHYDFTGLRTTNSKRSTSLSEYEDMSSDDGSERNCGSSNIIDVLSERYWPAAEDLSMDASQLRAFHTALTKELAIIQGPPGTGKTYVGLKIMKALLNNSHAWNPDHSKPLLVVCYTNHALDQFLEGILSFFKGDVLRVGGRSKNERLFSHNLSRKRLDLFWKRHKLEDDISDVLDIRQQLRDDFIIYQREIEEYGQQIDATASGILHEDQLKPFMKQFYRQIKKPAKEAQSALLEWLDVRGIGKPKRESSDPKKEADSKVYMSEDEDDIDEISRQRKVDDVDEILKEKTGQLSHLRRHCLAFSLADCDLTDKDWKQKYHSNMKKASRQTLKARIRKEILAVSKMDQHEMESVQNVWTLPPADRWRMYRYWVDQFCQELNHHMEPLKTECQNAADRYKEANGLVDKYIFEHSAVIGLTTTGAARYHAILGDIQPAVIIVEEAAEVLEGHIVTSLSPGCQHLILIGDHQQLRPSPNVYELAQRYHLDLSLFERMINNGLHCDTLELQHRMRPSISRVMRHIYTNLKDHDCVQSYEDILGVSENIYFINHNVPETENTELLSHLNVFEAEFMTQLCRYLLKQGYSPKQITVLSTYSAQVSCLRSLMRDESRAGLLITAVDNYQGEENDIILLSMVRSNKEKKIGFLKTDNRICVALSRARKGLYVIGNFDLLSNGSETWKNIVDDMKDSNQLGPGLELYCQTHPQSERVVVQDPGTFRLVPEGGCMKPCEFVLNCGHTCRKKCHAYDPEHEYYECLEPCQKTLCQFGHACPGKCSEECGPCEVLIAKTIPGCGHTEEVECYLDPKDHKCQHTCDEILGCGHKCGNICGYDHICYETVTKVWPCGHEGQVLCIETDTALCHAICDTKLKCGHICQRTCEECSEGRLHKPCKQNCRKSLLCGHECKVSCSRCPPCPAACENSCPHRKCDKICGQKCQPCMEPCTWSCSHFKCKKKCSEPCDRSRCDKRCRKLLKCKHTCIGLCGEKCPTFCRKCDAEHLKSFLPETESISSARFIHLEECGHIVEVKTMDNMFDNLQSQKEIQLPCCPWCSTPIRHNTRYGTIIKTILKNIELAKDAFAEMSKSSVEDLCISIQDDLDIVEHCSGAGKLLQFAGRDNDRLVAVKIQTEFLLQVEALDGSLQGLMEADSQFVSDLKQVTKNFKHWLEIERDVFTLQESSDARRELLRIKTAIFLKNIQVPDPNDDRDDDAVSLLMEEAENIRQLTLDKQRFTDETLFRVLKLREKMIQLYPYRAGEFDGLTSVETPGWKNISMEQGQWFSCPNFEEHVFNTNDLDGASGECPVCESLRLDESSDEPDETDVCIAETV